MQIPQRLEGAEQLPGCNVLLRPLKHKKKRRHPAPHLAYSHIPHLNFQTSNEKCEV